MKFEFVHRTYRLYGPDPTLHTLSKWLEAGLPGAYGDAFETLVVELCCPSDGPPAGTLEHLHAEFAQWRSTLPQVSSHDRGHSLRICLPVHWPSDRQLKREAGQALALKPFHRALSQSAEALRLVDPTIKRGFRFDSGALAADLDAARRNAPKTLRALVALYVAQLPS